MLATTPSNNSLADGGKTHISALICAAAKILNYTIIQSYFLTLPFAVGHLCFNIYMVIHLKMIVGFSARLSTSKQTVRRKSCFASRTTVFSFSDAAESPPMPMPATLPPPSPCKEMVFYEPKEYSPGLQLYWASCTRSLPDMAEALAHGAEVNWVNTEEDKRTPLIMAVQGVSTATVRSAYYSTS